MAEKRGKILVIRGGAIGDFILTLPALAALRSHFPETHLELLGYPVVAELARAGGIIDGFRSIDARPLAGFFARNGKLDPDLCEYFESFNLIISYLYDPDEIFKTNVSRATKAQFIRGQHRPAENESVHATSVFLKPLEHLAIFGADPVPKLQIHPGSASESANILAMHPGSGSEKKNWSEENWKLLLAELAETTAWDFLLVGGEAEGDRLHRLSRSLPSNRVRVAQSLPLVEAARQIGHCRFFVGHDSGITHIAAALGIPVLALWGPSNEEIWRPLNSGVHILKHPKGLAELRPNKVLEEILARIEGVGSATSTS